jgi:hypothetical protein
LTVPPRGATFDLVQLTIEIPDQLAERLRPEWASLAEIIERGLRQLGAESSALATEVIAFLARGPRPGEIVAFQPSEASVERARDLLEKNREGSLSPDEQCELDEMARLNQFFSLIRAQARRHLPAAS